MTIFLALLFAASASLQFEDPWVRLPPPGAPTAAAYVGIHNSGDNELVLEAVSSDQFGAAMFHVTRVQNGMARMQHLGSVAISPNETFRFVPGGAHIMLHDPVAPLADGDAVRICFTTDQGEEIEVEFAVRRQ